MKKAVFWESIYILLTAVTIGLLHNSLSPGRISLLYHPVNISDKDNISVSEAYRLYQNGRAEFIDTRPAEEFAGNHIPGSYNVPPEWPMDKIAEYMKVFRTEQVLVVYCSEAKCNLSVKAVGMLKFMKYSNVLLFRGGIKVWSENDFPLTQENDHQ